MSAMASQITSLYSRRRSKKTSKLHVTCLCDGSSPGTGEFLAPGGSNAENVSIWWSLCRDDLKQKGDSNPYIYIHIIVHKSVDCVCWGTRCFMHIRKLRWCGQNGHSHYTFVLRRKALDFERHDDIYFVLNSYTKGLAWIRTWHLILYSRFMLGLLTFIW